MLYNDSLVYKITFVKKHFFQNVSTLKNVNNCLNTNIYSYLETSGGQSSNLYLIAVHFLTPGLIRHLWQLKTAILLHRCLICTVPLPLLYLSWTGWQNKLDRLSP